MPQQRVNKAASAVLFAGTAAQREFLPVGQIEAPLFPEIERWVLFVDAGSAAGFDCELIVLLQKELHTIETVDSKVFSRNCLLGRGRLQ